MKDFVNVVTQDLSDPTKFHVAAGTSLGLFQPPKKHNPQPPFRRIGNGMTGKHATAYPLLETMLTFSKPESWFFTYLLKYYKEYTGESDISKESFSKADLNSISKAFALLHKRGLVKRVKRQVYMINPNAIITDNWKDHNNKWQSLP